MRVISGKYKRRTFEVPRTFKARPTTDFAKENLFNVLANLADLEECGNVLDLFAGSGQLALEALSRGAASALLCDNSREAAEIIKKNAQKTRLYEKCRIEISDALSLLSRLRNDRFDIVFLDPPYAKQLIPKVLASLLEQKLVKPTSLIVCEAASEEDFFGGNTTLAEKFEIKKQAKYGVAYVAILQPKEEAL